MAEFNWNILFARLIVAQKRKKRISYIKKKEGRKTFDEKSYSLVI